MAYFVNKSFEPEMKVKAFCNTPGQGTKIPHAMWWSQKKNQLKKMICREAVIRGKFIALNEYIRKEERPKINQLNIHFSKLKKEQ